MRNKILSDSISPFLHMSLREVLHNPIWKSVYRSVDPKVWSSLPTRIQYPVYAVIGHSVCRSVTTYFSEINHERKV